MIIIKRFFIGLFSVLISYSPAGFTDDFLSGLSSQRANGKPIYIQIFKNEKRLDLYQETGLKYELVKSYPICKFSGGLGPKKTQGDFKSPEGFYYADFSQLKPDSQYHRAINVGFPNEFDRQYGYTGSYLMIHGDCVSVGCYAMEDMPMQEIYEFAEAALLAGQDRIPIHIFPFEMNEKNLQKYSALEDYQFWLQLSKGYEYFKKHKYPPQVDIYSGQYVISQKAPTDLMLANNRMKAINIEQSALSQRNVKTDMVDYQENRRSNYLPSAEDENNLLKSIRIAQDKP